MEQKHLVAIRCFTYNHEKYIESALHGFVIQKTKFPFVAIVVDDASTDNEPKILWDFVNNELDLNSIQKDETDDYVRVVAPHKTNHNCTFVLLFLKYNHYHKKAKAPYIKEWQDSAKYIALCEGDDYWIDPLKLQKQVNILEKHPECSICFCKVESITKEGKKLPKTYPAKDVKEIFSLSDFVKWEFFDSSWVFHTSSIMYRRNIVDDYNKAIKTTFRNFPHGDLIVQLYALERGDGIYLPDAVSYYRVLSGGYNSYILEHIDKSIEDDLKKIKGIMEYDEYTNFKFHKYLKKSILSLELRVEKKRKNHLGFFKKKYIELYQSLSFKEFMVTFLKFYFPTVLNSLLSIKRKLES